MAKFFEGRKAKDLTKERNQKLAPIAKQIIDLISKSDLAIGEIHARDDEQYNVIAGKVLELMLKNKVKFIDKDFLFQLILQPFDRLGQIVKKSLGSSLDKIIDKAVHKEFRELTLSDMDEFLRT